MENSLKITKLETQMEEVNKKLSSQSKKMDDLDEKLDTKIDTLDEKLNNQINKLIDSLEEHYVRREEFTPVRTIVYSTVSIILAGVIGAILYVIGI